LVENTARADLTDLELAKEFQKRIDQGETHEQIAKAIKKSRTFVTQRLLLLKLPEERQRDLEEGRISFTDARILATVDKEPVEKQHGYAVTMEELEVVKLFKTGEQPSLIVLHRAYRKDLSMIRRALA